MKVAVFVDVPYYTSRLREIAEELGIKIAVCTSVESVPGDTASIFVDLSATAFDPIQIISSVKTVCTVPITAFVSGVQIDMKERAEKAGATEVLPRSMFVDRIEEALRT